MKRKQRVLFILPSLQRAGAEVQTVDLVNGLSASEYEKHLLYFEPKVDLLDRISRRDVKVHHVMRRSKLDWSLARGIARVIDEQSIDLVFCSLLIGLFWGWLGGLKAKRRIPLVVAVHTTINRSRKADLYDYGLYQWLLRTCDRVVFVCHAQQRHWQTRFPFLSSNSVCIHNGVDTDYFRRSAVPQSAVDRFCTPLNLGSEVRLICQIGAFRPEKGQRVLLEAFSLLPKELSNVHLVLAGDGPLRAELVETIDRLGLTGRVHLPGALSDVRPLLASSEWSLLPSTAETFSMAMLESLAMEVPMIASDTGGAREAILPNETGFLVEPGNASALSKQLREALSSNRSALMGLQGRQLVERRFEKSLMLKKYEALFQDIFCSNGKVTESSPL